MMLAVVTRQLSGRGCLAYAGRKVFEHRLLLLAEAFPPSLGGVQAYLAGLWGALPTAASFVVAATQPGDREWDQQPPYRIARAATRAWAYPRWRPAWQAARRLIRDAKIEALVCGKALFEGRAALRLQGEFGIPFIVCTYGMELPVWLRGQRTRADLERVLGAAARVVVINEQTKRFLLSLGVTDQRLVKIYPGVAEEFFRPPAEVDAFRARYRLREKRVVIAVARLVPRKGLAELIDAFPAVLRAVPGAQLLVVGDGPERPLLQARVERQGLVGAVTFLGRTPLDDVRRALAAAEVFALTPVDDPDDPEGFGIVYLEAAAAGIPAVASRAGGVPEAVLDSRTGLLVPARDPAATAAALVRVLTDDALRQRLGAAARDRAAKEFHWKGRAFLFQGMVHALLSERNPH